MVVNAVTIISIPVLFSVGVVTFGKKSESVSKYTLKHNHTIVSETNTSDGNVP